jgi:aspartyl-tRNA(Asn)/glutamyl-tRNA(Gln) amidotransferase subunit A
MARSSFDVALMLSAMAGEDLRDPFFLPNMNADFHESVNHSVSGLRVAVVTGSGSYHADARSAATVEHAANILKDAGCSIHHLNLPLFSLREAFDAQWGLALARLANSLPVEARAQLDPAMLLLAQEHASMSAVESLDAEVAFARFAAHMAEFHRDYDLLLCPVVPSQPPSADIILQNADDARWTRWGIWTFPFNISRQPAMSVPMGVDKMGLPTAVQIIAARFADRQVLRAAWAIERQCALTFPALESSPPI